MTKFARISSAILFLAVVCGALGAHGMEKILTPDRMETWNTAVLYHLIHGLAMFGISWRRSDVPQGPWIAFLCGVILFSGSLYLLCLLDMAPLAAFTPFGGTAFLVGWGWLVYRP